MWGYIQLITEQSGPVSLVFDVCCLVRNVRGRVSECSTPDLQALILAVVNDRNPHREHPRPFGRFATINMAYLRLIGQRYPLKLPHVKIRMGMIDS